jgi:phosphoinositide-3-kinase regulatory subunit 4
LGFANNQTEERSLLADVPNALSWQRIVETETNGYLVRQYLYNSLYDRMSTRPFLEDIEKKWLAFQLLCALRDCHARDVFHGDIKTENIFVTSWNWLYLSDFSSILKPTDVPEDDPAEFSYYFDTSGRRTCYIAPERFRSKADIPGSTAKMTWAMDMFSAGCVIAELFLEAPIFNLSQLFSYRKGQYDPSATHLSQIPDKDVSEMIHSMIQLDPEKRYSAEEYLKFFKGKVFPEYFYSFLHQYMGLITDPSSGRNPVTGSKTNLGEADERIDRIYYDFDKISYFLGYENEKQASENCPVSRSSLSLLPVHLNIPNNEHATSAEGKKSADDGTLIFLTLIVSSLRHTARATARIRACDILLAFAERVTDEAKLDRILPYVFILLNDKSDLVKVAAIRTLTQLMALVNVISPVNAHVFPEYVLPRMQSFVEAPGNNPSPLVRATYASCLGSLATTAARFLDMLATLKADGSLPTVVPEAEEGSDTPFHGLYDDARTELVLLFEGHTKALITDSDSSVRRAFLNSVPELCMFFGTAESNDIILSHLNTYLNDRDWMLKCAFFDTIVAIAVFLGGTTLEEFILPLLVQALTDTEDFVVERVLRSLANMAELGLFQRSKIWELMDVVARFTMHPNIWIREAAVMVISSSTKYLSSADRQCIVLPLLRPYLKTLIKDFSELSILDALKKPLPRPVLDLALNWAVKVDRGIFWKPVQQMRTFSFGGAVTPIPMSGKELGVNALGKVPKNDEDDMWLGKLRNMGMGVDDEWKLVALREYIWRMAPARLRDNNMSDPHALVNDVIQISKLGIAVQLVSFTEHKAIIDPLRPIKPSYAEGDGKTHTIADALLDASMTIDESLSRRKRSAYNTHKARVNSQSIAGSSRRHASLSPSPTPSSPIEGPGTPTDRRASQRNTILSDDDASFTTDGPPGVKSRNNSLTVRHKSSAMSLLNRGNTIKSVPETSTTSANAFGKVEGPFTQGTEITSAPAAARTDNSDGSSERRLKAAHDYSGNDPSVLKMLDSMSVDNFPNDLVEFGPLVTPMSQRSKSINRSSVQAVDEPWHPEGILVATFAEHIGPISRVVVSPDHSFFITGGDDGTVKVWDTARLERNIAHRSRQTHKHAVGSKITSLCFVENTQCFVSTSSDGIVNVVKLDYSNMNGNAKIGRPRVLREYQLPDGEVAVWSEHFRAENNSVLLLATNKSRILAIDLRDMSLLYVLENPVHHGTPTAFCIDRKRTWLLLGTSHGVLGLWDLRFKVRLKSWGVPGASAIYRLCIHPFKGRGRWVCVSGGSGQGEVSVWDIEKTQCREVYRVGGNKEGPKGYEPWPVDEDKPEGMLGRFATTLKPSANESTDRGVRAMVVGTDSPENNQGLKYGFLITGGSDKKIRFWDLAHVENSLIVSGLDVEESKPTFTSSHPTSSLTLNTERLPRLAPTANNAAVGPKGVNGKQSGRQPRSTVISLQQQQLLRSHLDSILDIALLESPYGMTVSVDRLGVIYVFQ